MGRADCKAERRTGLLVVKSLLLEEGEGRKWKSLVAPLAAAFADFAAFNGCTRVLLQACAHGSLAKALRGELGGA